MTPLAITAFFIALISGSDGYTQTKAFEAPKDFHVKVEMLAGGGDAFLAVDVKPDGAQVGIPVPAPQHQGSETTQVSRPGKYRLDVNAVDCDWKISVYP